MILQIFGFWVENNVIIIIILNYLKNLYYALLFY